MDFQSRYVVIICFFFFFQAEDGIRDYKVTGVQTCALPISSMSDALDFAFGKIGRTLAAGFASGILTGLAAILLLVPGIIVACGLSVAVQAAVLEPLPGGTDGLGRSWALTRGFRWRAFGLYIVVIVLLSLFLIGFGVKIGRAHV